MSYGFILTKLFDKLNISPSKLKFDNHNDVLDVFMLKHCDYVLIKARGPTGSAILPRSSRAIKLH